MVCLPSYYFGWVIRFVDSITILFNLYSVRGVDCVDLCTTSYHCWDCTLRACPITRGAAGGTSRTSAAGGPWFTSSGTDDIIFEQRRCPLLIQHSR